MPTQLKNTILIIKNVSQFNGRVYTGYIQYTLKTTEARKQYTSA
jgi:hypothetical protein